MKLDENDILADNEKYHNVFPSLVYRRVIQIE